MFAARSCFLVLVLTSAAQAQFAVSAPEAGPRPGLEPFIARAGDAYVVVWLEGRRSLLGTALVDEQARIVRSFPPTPLPQGLPLFPGTIAASASRVLLPGDCITPFPHEERSVCVSWIDLDDGSISAPELIEKDAIAASAAWNGREFLLTYAAGQYEDRELRARRISVDGVVSPAVSLGRWNDLSRTPSIAADGDSFYIAWHRSDEVSLVTEIAHGEVRSSIPIGAPIQHDGLPPHLSVAAHDGEIIVVTGDGAYRIFRSDAPVGPWQSIGRPWFEVFYPRAVRTGGHWSILFTTGEGSSDVRVVPVNAGGAPGAEMPLNATEANARAANFAAFDTAPSSGGFVLVWLREKTSYGFNARVSDVMFAPYSTTYLLRQDPAIVSIGVASQISPVAAFGGGAYLVAWSERNGSHWRLRAQRFGFGGEPVGPQIKLPFSIEDQIAPAIAFNGESFLLVWSEGPQGRSAIRGTRIAADGYVLDRIGLTVAGPAPSPEGATSYPARTADVAWSGASWVIASEGVDVIEVRRIAANGVILDPSPRVLPSIVKSRASSRPLVDCAPGGPCLVAWHANVPYDCGGIPCPGRDDAVVAMRVSNELELLDESPQTLVSPPDVITSLTGVAWNDRQNAWLVVWSGPSGRRISRSGVLLDPADVNLTSYDQFVSAAADGDGWHVVSNSGYGLGILTAFTTSGFTSRMPGSAQLALPKHEETEVFAVAGPRPLALFVQVDSELVGANRVFARFIDEAGWPRRRAVRR